MGVNKSRPHILVLPEDRANLQIATGFQREVPRDRQMQVLRPARGWIRVLELFESEHASEMDRCEHRLMVLLIDFDGQAGRLNEAKTRIPERLNDRVFVLGAWTKPEALKRDLGSYEAIGAAMAKDCRQETDHIWGHQLLKHNAGELERLLAHVRPILFSPD
jgi:hypothetical protein